MDGNMSKESGGGAVTVSLQELESNTVPFETLEQAFGPSSLGIIIVSGLPAEFHDLREKLLSSASHLAQLPASVLDSLVCSQAKYLTGWSHGVETLKPGVFDTQKGSFYVNCGAFIHAQQPVAEARDEFPEYTAPNVWPPEPSLPGFRTAFEELCTTIVSVAALVARACDRYAAAHIVEYESGYLERVVRESTTTKARLLHYFPPPAHRATADAEADTDDDSWCTTHIDHGCLTGLTSALYTDESKPLPETSAGAPLPALPLLSKAPDNAAGLYIRSRTGQTTKVSIPPTCLAFQTGEALELVTEGKFRAVPHFVRSGGKGMEGVARNTLAVFTQPGLDEVVDRGRGLTFRDFSKEVVGRHKPQA